MKQACTHVLAKGLPILSTLALILALAFAAVAQTQFGTILGTVTDPSGAVVAGATVTVTNTATGLSSSAETNSAGLYAVANLAAGKYQVTIEKHGFRKMVAGVALPVAETRTLDLALEVGAITETVTVAEVPVPINTTSAALGTDITAAQVANLPLATRNPYALIATAVGAADTGSVTGDTRGGNQATGEGLGVAVNGQRTSQLNFLLNGAENNDIFVAGVATLVPLDSIQEFKVQTSNFSAEFGRNPVVINLISKSGTNSFHGNAWEYYRGSGISASTVEAKAQAKSKPRYNRNDFGATVGGPIVKNKAFFFGSFEGIRVRSAAPVTYYVPTADFMSNASTASQDFINAFGGPPASNCANDPETAVDIWSRIEEQGDPADYGDEGGLFNSITGGLIPADTNLFCQTTFSVPVDSGGGDPFNDWRFTGRVDYQFTNATALMGYYAFENASLLEGAVSFSPYGEFFNTSQRARNQNLNLTLTHTFSPRFFSESRVVFNRAFLLQPEAGPGQAPETTPCWGYGVLSGAAFATITGGQLTLPGYVPASCIFAGIPFGGPQNIYQFNENMSLVRGSHIFKWGGGYVHLRDNRMFGAYQNGVVSSESMQNILDGLIDFAQIAIDPNGKVPGDTYCPVLAGCPNPVADGPYRFPSFTRHFHVNDLSFYGADTWKITSRLTLDIGLRWDYFGVQHSVGAEQPLDANLYLGAVGPPNQDLYLSITNARFRRTGQFYDADFDNFSPRVGIAYDIFGNGRTVFRGGYGLFYDRNFGNATFNAIQNPPNYAVINAGDFFGFPMTIEPNQFDSFGDIPLRVRSSARMLDKQLKTSYSEQWNATIEHDWFGKGLVSSLSYVGTNGIALYSLNNLNPRGGCLRLSPADQALLPNGCDPDGSYTTSGINQTGLTGMNRRQNEGFSRYNALQLEFRATKIGTTGLLLNADYTWAHAIDNSGSFFGDSAFVAFFGFGFRDPFNPALDKGSSDNDIRHRFTVSAVWTIPWGKGLHGVAEQAFSAWTLTSIITAQTGGAFSVYDAPFDSQCFESGTNLCYPVLSGAVPASAGSSTPVSPNRFALYTINDTFTTQWDYCSTANSVPLSGVDPFGCTAYLNNLFPELLSPRNLFRLPGIWGWDASVVKDFPLHREGMGLQFRAEFFNFANHSNLYAIASTNSFSGPGSQVLATRGCLPGTAGTCGSGQERRNVQFALKFSF